MIDVALIAACAPAVAPETVIAIVRVESGGDPLALNANRPDGPKRLRADDIAEAVRLAQAEIAAGNSVDVGLMQINSRNLTRLRVTVAEAFNPCVNLQLGALILQGAYMRAIKEHGEGQSALRAALSHYNTGDFVAGFNNGYVARYYRRDNVVTNREPATLATIYTADPIVYARVETPNLEESTAMHITPIVTDDPSELLTPGVQVELDPVAAEREGVIGEDTLSEQDALDSHADPHRFAKSDETGGEDGR